MERERAKPHLKSSVLGLVKYASRPLLQVQDYYFKFKFTSSSQLLYSNTNKGKDTEMKLHIISETFTDGVGEPVLLTPKVFTSYDEAVKCFKERISEAEGDPESYWEIDNGLHWDDIDTDSLRVSADSCEFYNKTTVELVTVEVARTRK